MDDYRTLAGLRGGRFTDCRRTAIYLFACSAAWFCHDPDTLENEVQAFTERYVDQSAKYTKQHIQEIIKRQGEAKQGKTREFRGKEVDPRYKHRNSTIIDQLGITQDEQHLLSTVIGNTEKMARERLRQGALRRKAGILERTMYLAKVSTAAQDRRQIALDLAEQGLNKTQIAHELSVSRRSVFKYLKSGNP